MAFLDPLPPFVRICVLKGHTPSYLVHPQSQTPPQKKRKCSITDGWNVGIISSLRAVVKYIKFPLLINFIEKDVIMKVILKHKAKLHFSWVETQWILRNELKRNENLFDISYFWAFLYKSIEFLMTSQWWDSKQKQVKPGFTNYQPQPSFFELTTPTIYFNE